MRQVRLPFCPAMGMWWTLRVGAFLCFVGHGAFGVITKEAWLPFFGVASIGRDTAFHLMPIIGIFDIVVGTLALVQPRAALITYMTLWAVWTAALRPLSGQSVWELFERAGNYGVPFALLLLTARSRTWRSWLVPAAMRPLTTSVVGQVRFVLAFTTAGLLIGHGALAVQHKPEIMSHYALLAPAASAMITPMLGWLEIGLGAFVLWRRSVGLGFAVCCWKLASESLFLIAGAPVWEVVERGGSYAAPLALALLHLHVRNGRLSS